MQEKEKIRREYILRRKNVTDKDKKSDRIFNKIINLEKYRDADVIALYCNYKDEVNTVKIIEYSLEQGKIVALPKVINEISMEFYDAVESSKLISKKDISLMIVPRSVF